MPDFPNILDVPAAHQGRHAAGGADELAGYSRTPTVATPARTLNSVFQPSTTRPVFCSYSAAITCDANEEGIVELLSDASNPPTTVRASFDVSTNIGATTLTVRNQLSYIVPAGHYVKIATTNARGTPAFSLDVQVEETL